MRQYTLQIIALLFAFALIGKFSGLAVFAESNSEKPIMKADKNDPSIGDAATGTSNDMLSQESQTDLAYSEALIREVTSRKGELDKQLARISARESELAIIEKRVAERMKALKNTNDELKKRLFLVEQMSQAEMVHLSKMYESMKPKQASTIFNKMDPIFAAGFLKEINSEQAGLIMANMKADKAYAISVVMANSNAGFRSKDGT